MAIAAKPDFGDPADHATRAPGDFARHPKTGAPYVAHPTETTKETGKKAELIVRCAERGIAVPDKVTVAQLHELLGPRPKKVQYGRPSGFGKYIELATAIQRNAERREALGVFLRPEVLEPLNHLERISIEDLDARDSELRKALDDVAAQALTAGGADLPSQRGTWFHAVSEHVDRGERWDHLVEAGVDLGVPYPVQVACVDAYRQALTPVEVLAIEATCVDDVWQLAGTLDRVARLIDDVRFVTISGEIVTLPAGTVMIWDIKSGSLFLDDSGFIEYWRSYAVQLASYQHSRPYDTETDTRGDWPWELDSKWAVIIHVDLRGAIVDGEAKCRLVLVDLEAGRYAGDLCIAARDWEKRRDVFSIPTDDLTVSVPVQQASVTMASPPVSGPVLDEPQPAAPPAAVVEDHADGAAAPSAAADTPVEEEPSASSAGPVDFAAIRRDLLRERWAALDDDGKKAYHSLGLDPADLDAVAKALDRLEHRAALAADNARRAERRVVDSVVAPTPGDFEGPEVDDATHDHLRAIVKALPADQLAIINAIAADARDAGKPLHVMRTRRTWEIVRALVAFVELGWDDEIVRDLVAHVLDDPAALQPGISLGVALCAVDVNAAEQLADLASRLLRGSDHLVEVDGHWRTAPVAA